MFLDLPLDVVFMEADDPGGPATLPDPAALPAADGREIERIGALLGAAERPVIMAGTDLYWGHGEDALRELSEALGIPVFLNGLARGCLPADHPNFYSRARSAALKDADVALVMGVPMDFRLGFGGSFGEDTQLVQIDSADPGRVAPRELAGELYGGFPATLAALRQAALDAGGSPERTAAWRDGLRETEDAKRAADQEQLTDDARPAASHAHLQGAGRHPRPRRDRDRRRRRLRVLRGSRHEHLRAGLLARPGAVRLPRAPGPGYAMAAKLARPDKQVCLLLGDGAFGFSGMEFDTMVRHGIPSSRWSATTASGRSRSTRWSSSTGTRSRPS